MQELEKILEEIEKLKEMYKESALSLIDKGNLPCEYDKSDIESAKMQAISEAITIIRKHMNDDWIPVEKYGFPKDEGVYDLTIINGLEEYVSVRWQFLSGTHISGAQHYVDGVHYWADNYRGDPINEFLSERVIAWRKKPEPYRPERSE